MLPSVNEYCSCALNTGDFRDCFTAPVINNVHTWTDSVSPDSTCGAKDLVTPHAVIIFLHKLEFFPGASLKCPFKPVIVS